MNQDDRRETLLRLMRACLREVNEAWMLSKRASLYERALVAARRAQEFFDDATALLELMIEQPEGGTELRDGLDSGAAVALGPDEGPDADS